MPEQILYGSTSNDMRRYNVVTGENTFVRRTLFVDGKKQSRVYANRREYLRYISKIVDSGFEMENFDASNNYLGGNNDVVFDSHVVGNASGGSIEGFVVSLDGNKIYYYTGIREIWVYDKVAGTATLITTATGSRLNGIDLDPLDQDSLVYVEFVHLYHYRLSTGVITQIRANVGTTNVIQILGGVVYGATFAGIAFKVNVDGTNDVVIFQGPAKFKGLYVDTIGKKLVYLNANSAKVYGDSTIADLPSDPSLFIVTPSPISLKVVWQEVSGATSYSLKYTVGTKGESDNVLNAVASTTNLRYTLRNLPFASPYTLYLYYSVDSSEPSVLVGSATHYTLGNLSGNYDRSNFEDGAGGFDLSGYSDTSLSALDEVLNDLFDTGDEIQLDIGAKKTRTRFVKTGESTTVEDGSALAFGFVPSAGAGQSATLTLPDSSSVVVSFDETTEEITIGGSVLTTGQSIILDGNKVTVYDL